MTEWQEWKVQNDPGPQEETTTPQEQTTPQPSAEDSRGTTSLTAAEIMYGKDGEGRPEQDSREEHPGQNDEKVPGPEEHYDIQLPEGTVVNEAMLGEFETLAKEHNLTNAAAKKLADLHMKSVRDAFAEQQKTLDR